jgi:hypothetical protein
MTDKATRTLVRVAAHGYTARWGRKPPGPIPFQDRAEDENPSSLDRGMTRGTGRSGPLGGAPVGGSWHNTLKGTDGRAR